MRGPGMQNTIEFRSQELIMVGGWNGRSGTTAVEGMKKGKEMKLFSQDFYDSKAMRLLFLVMFLFAPLLIVHAQDLEGGSYPGQTTSAQGTTKSGYVFPTKDERLKRYAWNTFGPLSLVGIGATAGFDQHRKDPIEWGQGGSAYGKRYASRFGQSAIEGTVTYGLSEAFRLDTGFRKSNRNGFGPRLQDALLQNVTSRTRSGKRILSAPRLAGAYVGGIIPAVT